MSKICPDCNRKTAVATKSKVNGRKVFSCQNPRCGLRYYTTKGKVHRVGKDEAPEWLIPDIF